MSKLAVFTSLFALIVMTGACPSWSMAQSPWQQSTFKENNLSVEVGAKIFDRPGDDSTTPVISDSLTNTTLFDQEEATEFGTSFGVEIKVNAAGRYNRIFEFRTVLTQWDESSAIFGNNLESVFSPAPLDLSVFTPPQSVFYNTQSDYYSFELMSKRAVCQGLTLSVGPRFISTDDTINIQSNTATNDPVLGPNAATQLNSFDAKNSLIGVQVGVEVNRPIAQSVYFTFFGRAGGYHNGTRLDTAASITDTLGLNTTPATATRRTRSTEAFVGELGGRVNVELLQNCISTYLGYEATVIDGIALSSQNLTNLGRIDTNNTLFFQAITFGVNLSY